VNCKLLSLVAMCLLPALVTAADVPPAWAYGFHEPAAAKAALGPPPALADRKPPPSDPAMRGLPGSTLQFTRAQIGDLFSPVDWYPADHPAMPEIVAHGRPPNVAACASCHYPNGQGRPENAAVAGLPTAYFVEQMSSFRHDERQTSDPRKYNTAYMAAFAKGLTDEEVRQAAEYFSALKFGPWISVIETDTVPQTTTSIGLFLPVPSGAREPIGRRIIEVPQDVEAVEVLRSPRVGFIAYAPVGSLKKGAALVRAEGGKGRVQCAQCHGPDLRGLANVPGIAGRSPSYLMRQLFDMKSGHRTNSGAEPMRPVLAALDENDLLAVVAYVASLSP
jgi:cytochrome c553